MRFALFAVFFLTLTPSWAQTCSTATIRGTYSVTCSGYISPVANTPQLPASIIGKVITDFSASITGGGTLSLGGQILTQTVTGTADVSSDCTGSVSYDQKINGQPAGKLNIVFHVLDNGKEIRGMSVDPGTTLSCSLRLMSK